MCPFCFSLRLKYASFTNDENRQRSIKSIRTAGRWLREGDADVFSCPLTTEIAFSFSFDKGETNEYHNVTVRICSCIRLHVAIPLLIPQKKVAVGFR